MSTTPSITSTQESYRPRQQKKRKNKHSQIAESVLITAKKGIDCSTLNCTKKNLKKWHKNPKDTTQKICDACYVICQMQVVKESGEICSSAECKSKKIIKMFDDPDDTTKRVCMACHGRILDERRVKTLAALGVTCQGKNCKSKKIRKLLNDPRDPTKKACMACYKKALHSKKIIKEEVAKESEGLPSPIHSEYSAGMMLDPSFSEVLSEIQADTPVYDDFEMLLTVHTDYDG